MERRGGGQKELGNNSTESPVKLPLAPIFSAPPDRRSNIAASFSTRRGSSIFSPTQTLAHPYIPPPPPPPSHHHEATSPDPDPASDSKSSTIRYKECLRNHAASMGAHVVDGCGEFMPAGEDGTPESLRCAACDCHRNFHRKETDGERAPQLPQRPAPHLKRQLSAAMVSFGAATESSSEDLNMSESAKKRFRTKFSQEQKDRMHELATRLEWRIQKRDEEEVQRFCGEVGVKRQVLKVWMHNNKQAMNKRHTSADD